MLELSQGAVFSQMYGKIGEECGEEKIKGDQKQG